MFGGAALYGDEVFFGLIMDDVLYLRVDDATGSGSVEHGRARQQERPWVQPASATAEVAVAAAVTAVQVAPSTVDWRLPSPARRSPSGAP